MEIGLDLVSNMARIVFDASDLLFHVPRKAEQYADSQGLKLVGYYQACERLDDAALAPVGEKVAEQIKAGFDKAIAFVVRLILPTFPQCFHPP